MAMGRSDYQSAKERFLDRQKRKSESEGWWKPTEGRHRIRILPPPSNQEKQKFFYVEYGVHYGLVGPEGNTETVTCPKATLKKPCPICEFTRGLWQRKSEEDQVIARKIGVKTRACCSLVFLNAPSEAKIWSFGKNVRDQLDELCFANEGSEVMIDDPDNGYNLTVTVSVRNTPDGTYPDYIVTPEMKSCAVLDKAVLGKTKNLAEMIHSAVKSYDEIRSILLGSGHEDGGEAPAPVARKVEEEPTEPASDDVVEDTPAPVAKASSPAPSQRPSADDLVKKARAALASKKAGQ